MDCCEPSLNAHIFHFRFFFSLLRFCFAVLLIFQADTSLFLFLLIAENLILHIFLKIMIIIPCSGMFHVPGFIDRPISTCNIDYILLHFISSFEDEIYVFLHNNLEFPVLS